MKKAFVDTDVCLDLLLERKPFYNDAARIFTLADQKKLKLFISSLIFANLDYMLKSEIGFRESRQALIRFKVLVNVLAVDDKIIELSLSSDFKDFEDAIQYYTSMENGVETLITRNLSDYKKAEITVLSPRDFLTILE